MKKILLLTFSFLNLYAFSQKDRTFNGELLYTIERISPKDSIPGKMLIYAKDSLQRVVNFSSNLGKQEMIKHLRLNKSFLLVTTTRGDYAIKTDHQQSDSTVNYSYKRKLGKLSVGGIKAKRAELSIKGIDKKFDVFYYKKIDGKYGSAYQQLPGLPVQYIVATEEGIYQYTLESIKFFEPPFDLFLIPDTFQKVSIEEFIQKVSAP
jgi:hypothetical protein